MPNPQNDPLLQVETTCGSLLYELQLIWDEVGESDSERDKMLLELEQECLEVYRRKVDQANRCRAQLRQTIADNEAELAAICSAMGERPVHIRQTDQPSGSLKDELRTICPQLEEMRKRKFDRKNQFLEVLDQIKRISNEIHGPNESISSNIVVDEADLSLRKLEEFHRQLHSLQKEKSERLKQIQDHLNTLNSLCSVLGMDFTHIASEVHPSFGDMEGPRRIDDDTIKGVADAIAKLHETKLQRMQKLQDLATTMLELWNLMDTPVEEQQMFQSVTCNVAAAEHEITEPNALSIDYINHVEAEVARLEAFKSSKMKELVLKKRSELEEICRKTRLIPEADTAVDYAIEAIESGSVDAAYVLEQVELQIAKAKEEAFSRKDILEKVEKWLAACEEESWLEEYNRDENRYNAGRGTHLNLKRAEKARNLVNKIPGMIETLASKTVAWEAERGEEFKYDGIRLLSMLEEYAILRQEKELERRRQRDQKKLQGQLMAEQEALYGSKPSPSKPQSVKKGPRMSTGGANNRRFSVGGAMLQTPKPDAKSNSRPNSRKGDRVNQNDQFKRQNDDSFSTLSAVTRGLDVAGLPMKKHSFGAMTCHEMETPMVRKPFSPISSAVSSKANMPNLPDDLNAAHKAVPANNALFTTTPVKTTTSSIVDEENRTPKTMPIPVPSTPSTVSVPMQTALTPAALVSVPTVEKIPEEMEYSFEEIRAGFVVSKAHLYPIIQV